MLVSERESVVLVSERESGRADVLVSERESDELVSELVELCAG